jgi:sugar-specific transcriptional regulator TrmB
MQRNGISEGPLKIFGISEAEEQAYRWLLSHPNSTTKDFAQVHALTLRKAQTLFDGIESWGLATRTLSKPRRYVPVAPDMAIETLARGHQNAIAHALSAIPELQKQAAYQSNTSEQLVELITGKEATYQAYERMPRIAKKEIIGMIRPPMLISRLDLPPERDHPEQRQAQERGVQLRSIIDSNFLALSGSLDTVRGDMKAGEQVRVVRRLPFKMLLTDRRLALIPLDLQRFDSPVLLVRSPALIDALYALFEVLWKRATPIPLTRDRHVMIEEQSAQFPEKLEELISAMAAGLNDKSISSELNLSRRTLNRRIAELMRLLDTRTRFQAGWRAALRYAETADTDKTL